MDPKLHQRKQRETAEATATSIANCAIRLGKIDDKLDQILANLGVKPAPNPTPTPTPASTVASVSVPRR